MAATYPQAVKNWVAHRNSVEDVDASHVNALQDEMAATQTVIGTSPHIDPTLNSRYNDYGTIRKRFEDISRGLHIPVVAVARNNTQQSIPNNVLTRIAWDVALKDPFNMFSSGVDVVVPRAGWWIWHGQIRWAARSDFNMRFATMVNANLYGTDPNNTNNHQWISTRNESNEPNAGSNLGFGSTLDLVTQGWYQKGAIIRIYGHHQAGSPLPTLATMSGTFIRDL